jgi:hypothetical protein
MSCPRDTNKVAQVEVNNVGAGKLDFNFLIFVEYTKNQWLGAFMFFI